MDIILAAVSDAFTWQALLAIVIGTWAGIIIGGLPGLGSVVGLTIFLLHVRDVHHYQHGAVDRCLLRFRLRRLDYRHSDQHPRHAPVGGDHLRWLPHDPAGARRRGAGLGDLRVLLRRHTFMRDTDFLRAATRQVRRQLRFDRSLRAHLPGDDVHRGRVQG